MAQNTPPDSNTPSKLRMLNVINRAARHDHLIMAALSLGVGLVTGVAVIFFREAIQWIQWAYYGTATERFYLAAETFPWWMILLVPTAGGLLVGIFIHWTLPERRPHGIPDVIEAYARRNAFMSFRTGMAAMLASAASVGCGASVGREGPAVHLGASLTGWLTRKLDLPRPFARVILGCGVSAAVAASFNAPIAGALFASEVIIGYYALRTFAPIVIASVAGTALTRIWFGDFPAFFVSETLFASLWEFPAFLLLGIVCAIVAISFMRSIEVTQTLASKLPGPTWYRPAIAGLGVGAIALVFPHVLGVGYGLTESAMTMQFGFWMIIGIALAKIIATALSLGFGFAGGVFSPALVIGALTGSAFGILATSVFPEFSSGPDAYALVGMGAVAAAVLGAPISTTLIVFELTGDYALTLGVMVSVVTATEITQIIFGRSFFSRQLSRRGVNLKTEAEDEALKVNTISQIMKNDNSRIPENTPLKDVRVALQSSTIGKLFVTNDDGTLLGCIKLSDLGSKAFDTSSDDATNAGSVANSHSPILSLKNDLHMVLELMNETSEEVIAIVDTMENMQFSGYITHHDVMQSYTRTLSQFRNEERTY
jgi:chloride channel protein, CIC family